MRVSLKVFGPYGLKPRVGEEMEKDFNEWMKERNISVRDITPATAGLPDRTAVLLIFYNQKEEGRKQ